MARLAHVACAATLFLTAATLPASADPIHILSGSLVLNLPGGPFGPVNLVGTSGFTLSARAGYYTGLGLFGQCGYPECPPGTRVEYNLDLSGSAGALGGVWSIGGEEYPINEGLDTNSDAMLHFDGSFIAPPMDARSTVSAPFTMTGRAYAISSLGEYLHNLPLFGQGIGTATLVPYNPDAGFPPSWTVESVRFDFAPQATPEPSTLLLLGTCAAGLLRRRGSRTARISES